MSKTSNHGTDNQDDIKALQQRIAELEKSLAREKTEKSSLHEHLQQYERAASGAKDGLFDWDLITNKAFVSKPWKSMLGYEENEISEDVATWKSLIHPEDLQNILNFYETFIQSKEETYSLSFRMRHKDGNYRWILSKGTLTRDRNNNPVRISGSHSDITERKIAEEQLVQNERKYRNLFENSLIGMVRSDAETGEILEANAKAWEIFNLKPATHVKISDFYLNKEDRYNLAQKLQHQGIIEDEEIQVVVPGGEKKWIAFSSTLYSNDNSIETVFRDITEVKETLLELKKVNDELDNFVYHASHDLRSPLRSVLGLLSILKVETDPEQQEKCIEMIEGSVKRLDKLVVDLLSISRNNRTTNSLEKFNFMIEINNTIENFYHVTDTKNLQIFTHISEPVIFVSDATRIRIILNNLISNALKYRSNKREISFLKIEVWVDEEEAHIEIEDNGLGIPETKKHQVFEMFYRASEDSEGSGLGLYIVKNVLEKLKGEITMDSQEDVGTVFRVIIPNLKGKEKMLNAIGSSDSENTSNHTVEKKQ